MKAFIRCIKILVACIFLHSQIAYSQSGDSLRVQSLSPNFPQIIFNDSAFEGPSYINITVTVLNLATITFSGNLYFELEIDTGGVTNNIDSLIPDTTGITIAPGDSLVVLVNPYSFTSANYKAGNNVVVVWPRLTTGTLNFSDSLMTEVFFIPLSGIDAHEADFHFNLFPSPTNDFIYVISKDKKDIERVRFYDMDGRLVKEFKNTSNSRFNISDFDKGCYFMEIILSKQRKMLSRVLKM